MNLIICKCVLIASVLLLMVVTTMYWMLTSQYKKSLTLKANIKDVVLKLDGSIELTIKFPVGSPGLEALKRLYNENTENANDTPTFNVSRVSSSTNNEKRTSYPIASGQYLLNNPHICSGINPLHFLIVVHTAPNNFERRRDIRTTWANKNAYRGINIKHAFFLGTDSNKQTLSLIENESVTHGDIVQGDFVDTYHNLTHKGILLLRWITEHCAHAQLIIKTDDDMFINIVEIHLKILSQHKPNDKLIMCHLRPNGTSPIQRDKGKWQVNDKYFRHMINYPVTYCNGYAVIISPGLVPALYHASLYTPFFWVDDVYLFGMLPSKINGVHYKNVVGNYSLAHDRGLKCFESSTPCKYIVVSAGKTGLMETLWIKCLQNLSPNGQKYIDDNLRKILQK